MRWILAWCSGVSVVGGGMGIILLKCFVCLGGVSV